MTIIFAFFGASTSELYPLLLALASNFSRKKRRRRLIESSKAVVQNGLRCHHGS
jgi:hypothetical protein